MDLLLWILPGFAAMAVLAWPRYGLLPQWRKAQALAQRTLREDAIKHIVKCEANRSRASISSIAGALQIKTDTAADLLKNLEARGLLTFGDGQLRLKPAGRELGLHIVRAHRLWESYLAEQTGVLKRNGIPRRKQEHLLTREQADALSARLGHPTHDRHGDRIPELGGALESESAQSLNSAPPETPVLITHIEDEPATIYQQLMAIGLRPGVKAFVLEKSPARIRFWANGSEHRLDRRWPRTSA